jgi:hypothetical protein
VVLSSQAISIILSISCSVNALIFILLQFCHSMLLPIFKTNISINIHNHILFN